MRSLVLVSILVCHFGVTKAECPDIHSLNNIPLDDLTAETFRECDSYALLHILGATEILLADTSAQRQLTGDIWLNILADELQNRKKEEDFDPSSPEITRIVKLMAGHQYHIALVRPSDTEKLIEYLKQGRFQYVLKRFFDRNVHLYFLTGEYLLILLILFGIYFRRQRMALTSNQSA